MNDLRERVARADVRPGLRVAIRQLEKLAQRYDDAGDASYATVLDKATSTLHRLLNEVEADCAADAAIAATKLEREVFVLRDGELISEMEPVPATSKGQPCCTLCETPLDQPGRPWTRSCGGDCLACMADVGDPDCVAAMATVLAPTPPASPETGEAET